MQSKQNSAHGELIRDGKYVPPKFTSIFEYHANPYVKRIDLTNEWMDWMFQFSLIPKDHYERRIREASILTASYLYPCCKDIYKFQRIVKWIAFLFIFDDINDLGRDQKVTQQLIDEVVKCVERLEAIYVNDKDHKISLVGCKPFIVCIYFVVEDILLDFNLQQRKSFLAEWKSFIKANAAENELVEKQALDFDEICRVRLRSAGIETLFSLIEYSEKIHLDDQFMQDERFQRLKDLCNLCVIFVNDLYSFEKEYVEQNEDMSKMVVNIVGFHVLKYKCSISEAMERSLEVIRDYERQYNELAKALRKEYGSSDSAIKFIKALTDFNG
ncbi:(+)-T-muurolol synthase ((2E,6E)-farnesyl diphosphate cyclizing), partial [Pseudolycoriella hygida]